MIGGTHRPVRPVRAVRRIARATGRHLRETSAVACAVKRKGRVDHTVQCGSGHRYVLSGTRGYDRESSPTDRAHTTCHARPDHRMAQQRRGKLVLPQSTPGRRRQTVRASGAASAPRCVCVWTETTELTHHAPRAQPPFACPEVELCRRPLAERNLKSTRSAE